MAQINAKMSAERDKRVGIRALLNSGLSVSEVARQMGASRNTVAHVRDFGVERKEQERERPARTPELVAQVEEMVDANPNTSVRALARETGMAEATMRQLVKEDLRMRSYVKQERSLLSEDTRRRREDRAKSLVNRLKGPDAGLVILFSDEKFFTLAQYHNRRNSKVVLRQGEQSELRVQGVAQRPAGIMFLGIVASDGKVGPPIFVEAGVKIDSAVYQDILRREVKPWVDANYAPGSFIFQQDGATAHTAASTQAMIKEELGWRYWTKEVWPPSSPDLNPLDYGVWDKVAQVACKEAAPNLNVLRQRVAQAWTALEAAEVRHICRGFRRRLAAVVTAEGGHIDL